MTMDIYHYLELLLVPITSVVSWFAGARIRRNSTLKSLQETINMLVGENKKTYEELVATRKELAEAMIKISILEANQEKLLAKK